MPLKKWRLLFDYFLSVTLTKLSMCCSWNESWRLSWNLCTKKHSIHLWHIYLSFYIYQQNKPNVGKYTIHGWYGRYQVCPFLDIPTWHIHSKILDSWYFTWGWNHCHSTTSISFIDSYHSLNSQPEIQERPLKHHDFDQETTTALDRKCNWHCQSPHPCGSALKSLEWFRWSGVFPRRFRFNGGLR